MGFLVLLGALVWYLHNSAANSVAAEAAVLQIIVTKCLACFFQVRDMHAEPLARAALKRWLAEKIRKEGVQALAGL